MLIDSKYIATHCFTKKHSLNNRVCLPDWWNNRGISGIYNTILQQTTFLQKNVDFSERLYCIYHDIKEQQICEVCSTNPKSFRGFAKGYYKTCSRKCSYQNPDRNKKIQKNRDYKDIVAKTKQTNLQKYGTEYSWQNQNVIDKINHTKLQRYGNKFYNNLTKARQTNLSRYGVEYTGQIPQTKEKIRLAAAKRTPELFDANKLVKLNETLTLTEIAKKLEVTYRTVWLAFVRLDIEPKFYRPDYNKMEKEIASYLISLNQKNILLNDRTIIKPKELDIYLPEHKLAIELNGVYWHSFDSTPSKTEKERHLIKLKLCQEKGIRLLQIFDDEWIEKKPIIQDIIRRSLGLSVHKHYARNLIVEKISAREYTKFLNINHLQGHRSAPVRYGLKDKKGNLISIMGVGKARYNIHHDYELIRYCSLLDHTVIGGAKKLIYHILNEIGTDISIISYSDRRLFTGKLYSELGFENSQTTPLDYYWVKHNKRFNRSRFQKHKLPNLLKIFDPNKSERENMFANGYRILYGCGHDVWQK